VKLTIAAVGRLRQGPEADLVADYAKRAGQAGKPLALGPLDVTEIDDRRARDRETQGARLLEATEGQHRILLDERGRTMPSDALAEMLARLRDDGVQGTAFLIGGAEGHPPALRESADTLLSLGPMVWPHMLVRVMMAEQLYRAVTILAGTPYHRG